MNFTDREKDLMSISNIGDIIPAQGRLVRIVEFDEVTNRVGMHVVTCEWFLWCDRDAVTLAPHLQTYVAVCDHHERWATYKK